MNDEDQILVSEKEELRKSLIERFLALPVDGWTQDKSRIFQNEFIDYGPFTINYTAKFGYNRIHDWSYLTFEYLKNFIIMVTANGTTKHFVAFYDGMDETPEDIAIKARVVEILKTFWDKKTKENIAKAKKDLTDDIKMFKDALTEIDGKVSENPEQPKKGFFRSFFGSKKLA